MRNFWCEIDVNLLEYNVNIIKQKTKKKIMAVVKGDAYGLGIEGVTSLIDNYVDAFAAINIEEALRVKSSKDILILNPVLSDEDIQNLKENFIVSIDDFSLADRLGILKKDVRAHIYVDTGMNRFGVKCENLQTFINEINEKYPHIKIEGLYTHLHNTKDREYTLKQIEKFKNACLPYKELEIHVLNSPGFLSYNDVVTFDTMIRVGNLIYGYDAESFGFKKAFSFKAVPLRTYDVKKGEYIGYGNLYRAKKDMKISILDIGYIDNFDCFKNVRHNVFYDVAKAIFHHLKYQSGITYKGQVVKIIGKPNMNFTIINNENFGDDAVFNIDISPITADSSIPKKYRKGDEYVQF